MRRPLRSRVWFYKPEWYWHRWSPVWFGNDEYHWKTLVLGWSFTGRIVIALHEFDTAECDDAECAKRPPASWEVSA